MKPSDWIVNWGCVIPPEGWKSIGDDPAYVRRLLQAEQADLRNGEDLSWAYRQLPLGEDKPSDKPPALARGGLVNGAAFALDEPAAIAPVWGMATTVLWAEGEPAMLYGPDGVGKTTLAQQLLLRRLGIGGNELLGHPVAPTGAKALYLAMDRPKQAARSLQRMVGEEYRVALQERLVVWRGSPPIEILKDPDSLAHFATEQGADTILIDSLKDLVPKLSDEDTGTAIHRAWQACMEAGQEVLSLHHPRKAQADNKKPRALADVYGSRWITAGCGSVLLLWGEAGDPVVQLEHLKQPADVVGPLTLLHDNRAGTTSVLDSGDVVALVAAEDGPATVAKIAMALFRTPDPDRNRIEKTRRRLETEVKAGRLERLAFEEGKPVLYRPSEEGSREGSRGVTQGVTLGGHAAPYVVVGRDPPSRSTPDPLTQLSLAELSDTDLQAAFPGSEIEHINREEKTP